MYKIDVLYDKTLKKYPMILGVKPFLSPNKLCCDHCKICITLLILLLLGFTENHWEELDLFNHTGIEVSKYRSTLTGLTIDLAKTDTPIVKVDICLARKDEDKKWSS